MYDYKVNAWAAQPQAVRIELLEGLKSFLRDNDFSLESEGIDVIFYDALTDDSKSVQYYGMRFEKFNHVLLDFHIDREHILQDIIDLEYERYIGNLIEEFERRVLL